LTVDHLASTGARREGSRIPPRAEALQRMNAGGTLSVYDTVAATGLGEVTVRRAVADGTLPSVRLGGRIIRIPASAVARLLTEGA
jgi:excisionase family DNA binding protein